MLMICLTSVNDIRTDSQMLDDCIRAMAAGDSSGLAQLYEQASPAVYGFALSVLKNRHDAEDVLQDCFINAFGGAAGYRSAGKPMAWLLTITKNLCMQKLRERRRSLDIPEEDWERYIESIDRVTPEDRLVLTEVMRTLSDEERQIVVLHAVGGFKHREIAELMEMPLATVLSKYSRSIKKLRKHL
ncbi:MAG: RNA polymerase sigma factor [Christensenellales bacterium]